MALPGPDWQRPAVVLRRLHGTAPRLAGPPDTESGSLPSCEHRQHEIFELKLGTNLRDFLVHYLHFILRKTKVKEA